MLPDPNVMPTKYLKKCGSYSITPDRGEPKLAELKLGEPNLRLAQVRGAHVERSPNYALESPS